ncbi:hypothetical protein [Pseudarthrobacter sp. TAF60_1]|uniref:hypothetical protein n=1 Tax=Pseudarthrobacter sp. TAF60_1 TaxID=3233071 RepID=UPI003F9E4B4E
MLTEHDYAHEPAARVTWSTYEQATASAPAQVFVELRVDRNLNRANLARLRVAEDRLIGGTDQVCGSIDNVATGHLQELTGTRARIADSGYALTIEMHLPNSAEVSKGPAASGTGNDAASPLTSDQQWVLPELVRSIEAALPPQERHRTELLALMIAREIPPTADVIRSSDRVTLEEIIDHHEQRMGSDEVPLPASIRLAGISFPHHPGAALHHEDTTASASTGAARPHRISPALER